MSGGEGKRVGGQRNDARARMLGAYRTIETGSLFYECGDVTS